MRWRDLSDGEIRARLVNRGIEHEVARFLVDHREHPLCADRISRILER